MYRHMSIIAEYQTKNLIAFYGNNGGVVLGNFFIHPLSYNGVIYQCAEAAYQAQKNPLRCNEFANLDGNSAFILGRQVQCRSDWNNVKYNIMRLLYF